MATLGNAALWRELQATGQLGGPSGWVVAVVLGLAVATCLMALTSLLAWRWTFKPVLMLLLLICAAGTHFMLSYHIVIDRGMIINALQTDRQEASALLDGRMIATLLALGLLPALVVWRFPVRHLPWRAQALRNLATAVAMLAGCAAVLLLGFQPLASTMRNHKQVRYLLNPLNILYAAGQVAVPARRQHAVTPLGADARLVGTGGKPVLLVLVLGETGRSGNFGLNGYERPTTPELARENVASARHVTSCGTSTAASVPCMFSHLGRTGFDGRSRDFENLLDVAQHAGLAVLWVDNQSGCKGVCDRVPHVSTSGSTNPRLCPQGECLDGVMLAGLQERLQALPAERVARGVVLVLHQIGSHGPAYYLRAPPEYKRFLPECRSVELQDCSSAELVNAYDNSIAYTDHFLAATIGWLKQQQAAFDPAMLYVADHGESLGEHNLYLHGMPFSLAPDVQKQVPWITWLSAGFEQRTGLTIECLRSRGDAPLAHDHYFHSVLGLLQVQTSVYEPRLDAYAPCTVH